MNTYDWTKLTTSPIYAEIIKKWELLLANKKALEGDYHKFLRSNPAFFFTTLESYLVVSKLKLGTEYETDFVVVKEGYSDGTKYDVIEIESPHTELFTRAGHPTENFNSALQQIRDWQRFLSRDKNAFRKIFPTTTTSVIKDSKLSFKIIIGRRTDNEEVIEKRRQIMEKENIEVLSFDRLTDIAKRNIFLNDAAIYAAQMNDMPYSKKNELANPFYMCTSDSEWRQIFKKGDKHFYSNMLEEILSIRKYNPYFKKYTNYLNTL